MYLDSCSTPGLRFSDYARSLVNTAENATQNDDGALTIGIFGKWGTGKTTLMRCVEKEFFDRKAYEGSQYKTIWFSPWKYDSKEKIWNALIQSILAEIEKDIDIPGKKSCRDLAWLMKFYTYEIGRELLLGWVKQKVKRETDIDLDELQKISEVESESEMYRSLNRFEDDFKKLVEDYVGKRGKLVIFIDDLDRCLPKEALTVLEALKLYLDRANCIFFIGLDRRTIEQAVYIKYASVEITGKDYLEKMIHLNFFIPENDPNAIEDMLKGQMNPLVHHVNKKLWRLIGIATGQNLRRMKQYLIAWNLQKELLRNIEEDDLQEVAIFLLIQMYFPKFYDSLSLYNYDLMELFARNINGKSDQNATLAMFPDLAKFLQDDTLKTFFGHVLDEKCLASTGASTVTSIITKLSTIGQIL